MLIILPVNFIIKNGPEWWALKKIASTKLIVIQIEDAEWVYEDAVQIEMEFQHKRKKLTEICKHQIFINLSFSLGIEIVVLIILAAISS